MKSLSVGILSTLIDFSFTQKIKINNEVAELSGSGGDANQLFLHGLILGIYTQYREH